MYCIAPPTIARIFSRTVSRRLPIAVSASLHTLPKLRYGYEALEPYISREIMSLHHLQHHQAYVDGLNDAEARYAMTEDLKERIRLLALIKFHGGGHVNHSLFWLNLYPAGPTNQPSGALKAAIERDFTSFEDFKTLMYYKTNLIQGSGWGWLGYSPETKKLEVVTTANQDPLLSHIPILGIDIWEHAYYLQYKNSRPAYLTAIWNVIDFQEAGKRYDAAVNQKPDGERQ